jgi:hypothetical protein
MPATRAGMFALAFGAAAAVAGVLVACNAVLGIDQASPEPKSPGGSSEAGTIEAGDGGVFVARDDCKDYCADMAISCGAMANQEYLSADVCNQLCAFHTNHYDEQGLDNPVDVSATSPTASGDSVYCRVWHSHAALENPQEHCPHAGPLGAEFCGTNPCDDFCSMAVKFCPTSYADMGDCLQSCGADGGYPGYPYLMGDASDLQGGGNTLNCRMYHLENFLFTGDAIHCTHITADGGGVCVN